MRTIVNYYRKLARQAWVEFWKYFDLHTIKAWLNLLLPVVFGFLLTWLIRGAASVSSDLQVWLVNGLGVALIWGVLVFVAHLIIAPVQIDQTQLQSTEVLKKEKRALEERLIPRLEIVYREEPPFQEIMPIWDNNGNALAGTQKWIRVGVHNLSVTESIQDITVELERIDPNVIHHLPISLQQMHGKEQLSLGPDETRYADVVSLFLGANVSPYKDHFAIHHSVPGVANIIPVSLYKITVVVRGHNVGPVRKVFQLGIDHNYEYFFEPV